MTRQAMIFAAGLGTRLKPLTDTMPKALVRVGDRPLIEHVVLKLKAAGFHRIVVNAHHFGQQVIDFLASRQNFGLDILISDEREQLLDTGGGIRKALPLFSSESPVLIHNVDILSNADLDSLYRMGSEADAALLVSERPTSRYLLFNPQDDLLQGWMNKQSGQLKTPFEHLDVSHCRALAFSGIHVLNPSAFPSLAAMPERFGIIDFYLSHCRQLKLRACIAKDLRLLDVGKPEALREAGHFLAEAEQPNDDTSLTSF